MIPDWGYSYALYPYLSSMIGAVFVKVAALFTGSARVLRAASRMCSVLSITGCCFICLKLGRRLFERRSSAVLFASLVCFLPQVLFLGMYHNNDALSLFAVAMMLFFFVDGYEKKWPVKSCVGLAAAFSVGLLSYYPIYGWILMCAVFCAVSIATDRSIPDRGALFRKRAALIAALCLLFAGWFFLRSALLHDGDLLGFRTELSSRERMREQGALVHDYVCYRSASMSIPAFLRVEKYGFIRLTAASFIGLFGNMAFPLPMALYGLYTAIFVLGLLLFAAVCSKNRPCRRDRPLMYLMTSSVLINIALHFWHSYARDFQPQGRYIITAILPLAYMVSYGLDRRGLLLTGEEERARASLDPAAALTLVWLLLCAWACLGTMPKMLA